MTETQLLLHRLGWSQEFAAGQCGVTLSQMRYWATGINTRGNPSHPPARVLEHLRACVAAMPRALQPSRQDA